MLVRILNTPPPMSSQPCMRYSRTHSHMREIKRRLTTNNLWRKRAGTNKDSSPPFLNKE